MLRPSLRSGKLRVPGKMIGTLTLSFLKFVHTSISCIFPYKLYFVATPGHSERVPRENHVRIVTLTTDLQGVSLKSATDFLYHSCTTELQKSAALPLFRLSPITCKRPQPSPSLMSLHILPLLTFLYQLQIPGMGRMRKESHNGIECRKLSQRMKRFPPAYKL